MKMKLNQVETNENMQNQVETSRNKYHDSVSTIVTEHGPYECVVMTKTIFDIEPNKQADISC